MSAAAQFETPFPAEPLYCGEWPVEEGWIDYNRHMNIGYYGVAFDRGVDVVFDHWIDWGADYVAREGMGPFALQSQLHFLDELKLGERFAIRMLLLDADAKRIHYCATMENVSTGSLSAVCETLSINVDLTARRSAPLPERQGNRLQEMLAAHRDLERPAQVGRPLGIRRGG